MQQRSERTRTAKRRSSRRSPAVPVRYLVFFAVIAAAVLFLLDARLHIFPRPARTGADFGIRPYISAVDQDGDGTDDQTDILESARAYVATCPKYQSKYYASGYPDDEYGVCTDVVAFALRGAGYDLQKLVDMDIRKYPGDYDIEKPDPCIDFRRVVNLEVYFRHTAISLTCDINEIDQWQGGDIVIFPHHIAVISDLRNGDGIPYIIHHGSPLQQRYEEDVLARYTILGHYRIS